MTCPVACQIHGNMLNFSIYSDLLFIVCWTEKNWCVKDQTTMLVNEHEEGHVLVRSFTFNEYEHKHERGHIVEQ